MVTTYTETAVTDRLHKKLLIIEGVSSFSDKAAAWGKDMLVRE